MIVSEVRRRRGRSAINQERIRIDHRTINKLVFSIPRWQQAIMKRKEDPIPVINKFLLHEFLLPY